MSAITASPIPGESEDLPYILDELLWYGNYLLDFPLNAAWFAPDSPFALELRILIQERHNESQNTPPPAEQAAARPPHTERQQFLRRVLAPVHALREQETSTWNYEREQLIEAIRDLIRDVSEWIMCERDQSQLLLNLCDRQDELKEIPFKDLEITAQQLANRLYAELSVSAEVQTAKLRVLGEVATRLEKRLYGKSNTENTLCTEDEFVRHLSFAVDFAELLGNAPHLIVFGFSTPNILSSSEIQYNSELLRKSLSTIERVLLKTYLTRQDAIALLDSGDIAILQVGTSSDIAWKNLITAKQELEQCSELLSHLGSVSASIAPFEVGLSATQWLNHAGKALEKARGKGRISLVPSSRGLATK